MFHSLMNELIWVLPSEMSDKNIEFPWYSNIFTCTYILAWIWCALWIYERYKCTSVTRIDQIRQRNKWMKDFFVQFTQTSMIRVRGNWLNNGKRKHPSMKNHWSSYVRPVVIPKRFFISATGTFLMFCRFSLRAPQGLLPEWKPPLIIDEVL